MSSRYDRTDTDTPTAITDTRGLSICLLGGLRVYVGNRAIDDQSWQRKQAKTLLKLLVIAPDHSLHKEAIIDRIWPNATPNHATRTLNKILHVLRHTLEPELAHGKDSAYIQRDSNLINLVAPHYLHIDVERFQQQYKQALTSMNLAALRAAANLYTGELLPEDRFESSFEDLRNNLAQCFNQLLIAISDMEEADKNYSASIHTTQKLLSADPTLESAHRRLMRLYALTGQRSQALNQFDLCKKELQQMLDVSPDSKTLELIQNIRAGELVATTKSQPSMTSTVPKTADQLLAILPLENSSKDQSIDYLCKGIPENLIHHISRLSTCRIIAWSTILSFSHSIETPQKAGIELGVAKVLSGKVIKQPDGLSVSLELIDTSDGTLIWTNRFTGKLSQILSLQTQMADEISQAQYNGFHAIPPSPASGRKPSETTSEAAYHAYLKGRYHWNKRSAKGLRSALLHFREATDHDPLYAKAYAGLADTYNLLSLYSGEAPKQTMPKARAAAQQALALDETLSEAHTSLAYCLLSYNWDFQAAEHSFQTSLTLNEDYPTAHQWYHKLFIAAGQFQQASLQIRQARET